MVADILSESEEIKHMNKSALNIVLFEMLGQETMGLAYRHWLGVASPVLGAEPREDADSPNGWLA